MTARFWRFIRRIDGLLSVATFIAAFIGAVAGNLIVTVFFGLLVGAMFFTKSRPRPCPPPRSGIFGEN
jgi:ABC-type Co2+ transport system permease subunit